MDMLFILVPIAIILVGFAAWGMRWALKSGQFDDMDSPASSILFDDDEHMIPDDAKVPKQPNDKAGDKNNEKAKLS
jgi:cbb3-type cytochrome oxidase maturation protein